MIAGGQREMAEGDWNARAEGVAGDGVYPQGAEVGKQAGQDFVKAHSG